MTRFSLILATVDRVGELERFLKSLEAQSYNGFDLIIVDQNPDDRLIPVLNPFGEKFSIRHLRSERGLSKARNVGLKQASGDIVAFPDDDCWYPPNLLEQVSNFLKGHSDMDGVTGRAVDEFNNNITNFDESPGLVQMYNAWRRAVSFCIFLRSRVVQKVGGFDESLGVGSGTLWGGAEEVEYVVRAGKTGFKVYYDPTIIVNHPNKMTRGYDEAADRSYRYGAGIGRVWRKHGYPIWYVTYYLFRPGAGAFLSLLSGNWPKANYHWGSFRGRLKGWLSET